MSLLSAIFYSQFYGFLDELMYDTSTLSFSFVIFSDQETRKPRGPSEVIDGLHACTQDRIQDIDTEPIFANVF